MSGQKRSSVVLDPRSPEGQAVASAQKLAQAGKLHEAASTLEPHAGRAAVDVLLGTVLSALGEAERAYEVLERAVASGAPARDLAPVMGEVLVALGRNEEAIRTFAQVPFATLDSASRANLAAAKLRSGLAQDALQIMSVTAFAKLPPQQRALYADILLMLGEPARAVGVLEELDAKQQLTVEGKGSLALGWALLGKLEQADALASQLLATPGLESSAVAAASNVRGRVARARGDGAGAARWMSRARDRDPSNPWLTLELASSVVSRQPGEAERLAREVLEAHPDHGHAWLTLGNALRVEGRVDDALDALERASASKTAGRLASGVLAYTWLFSPRDTPADARRRHAEASRRAASELPAQPRFKRSARSIGARLRLGFVSDDLREHPVGYFVVRVLEALGRDHVLFAYGKRDATSRVASRVAAAGVTFREVSSDAHLVSLARGDDLDVAFDLVGFLDGSRLGAFGARLAPVQATWAGYMATTGAKEMDLLIADRHHVPEGAEGGYSERVVRMPHSFIAYDPPPMAAPSPVVPSALRSGVTYGAFHVVPKLCDRTLDAYAAILKATPHSRLLLKTSALDCPLTRGRVVGLLDDRGIPSSRVKVLGHTDRDAHVAALAEVDVALDALTFSGSTTTLETLLMGVPVVTLPGDSFASRHSTSFLSSAGHPEWIASSVDDYVQKAVALARNVPLRRDLREAPRERLISSPLCDGGALAAALVEALRQELARKLAR